MRKSLFIGLLALSSTMIFAQNQEQRIKEPEKITFKPHWFIQAQIGAAHTIGEAKFTDLVSPAAALNVGYKRNRHDATGIPGKISSCRGSSGLLNHFS